MLFKHLRLEIVCLNECQVAQLRLQSLNNIDIKGESWDENHYVVAKIWEDFLNLIDYLINSYRSLFRLIWCGKKFSLTSWICW